MIRRRVDQSDGYLQAPQPSTLPGGMGKRDLDQGAASVRGLPPRMMARAFW